MCCQEYISIASLEKMIGSTDTPVPRSPGPELPNTQMPISKCQYWRFFTFLERDSGSDYLNSSPIFVSWDNTKLNKTLVADEIPRIMNFIEVVLQIVWLGSQYIRNVLSRLIIGMRIWSDIIWVSSKVKISFFGRWTSVESSLWEQENTKKSSLRPIMSHRLIKTAAIMKSGVHLMSPIESATWITGIHRLCWTWRLRTWRAICCLRIVLSEPRTSFNDFKFSRVDNLLRVDMNSTAFEGSIQAGIKLRMPDISNLKLLPVRTPTDCGSRVRIQEN
jgi:hypothetical protein